MISYSFFTVKKNDQNNRFCLWVLHKQQSRAFFFFVFLSKKREMSCKLQIRS